MLKFTDFFDKYTMQQYANWEMIENKVAPPIKALQEADLVLYQPLSDVYGCYSTNPSNPNNLFSLCSEDTQYISFPRIHMNALWPIFNKHAQKNEYYGDDCIEYYKSQKVRCIGDYMKLYDRGDFDFQFPSRFAKNKTIFQQKEYATDIKVFDYIQDNLPKFDLFLTHDHPTTRIFHHCVEQMLSPLDITFNEEFDITALPDNIAQLQDSVYGRNDCRYPVSQYAVDMYKYSWATTVDAAFYRTILEERLRKAGLQ